ncbi:MAG TPA: peptidoglycan-binding domain-containing protein [Pyrinomonadaceae bacterium]|nr:peptidoglycan-binding domain-containing protein [Pyrinomonadaceae bacterium]
MKILIACLTLLVALSAAAAGQQPSAPQTNPNANTEAKKRGPVFRATKEQIKQAQSFLKQRGLYAGEPTGKLDDTTRAALRKYQEAEGIRVTGTLNRLTLEKMGIQLTDKQKATDKQTG